MSTGLEILAENAVGKWQEVSEKIRREFGKDSVRNAVYASSSPSAKKADLDLFFGSEITTSALFNNCTLAIIKPHVVAAG